MRTRRGTAFWPDGLSDMITRFQPGDIVVPVTSKQEHFLGVVKEVLPKINKIVVLWNGGSSKQHDPDEIMLDAYQSEIVRTRMSKTRRVRGAAAKEFSANFRQGGARTARLSPRDTVRWLQKNVSKLTVVNPESLRDEVYEKMIEDGIADDNDRDYSVIVDMLSSIRQAMKEDRKDFKSIVKSLNPMSVQSSDYSHLRSRRAIDFPTQDAYDKYMEDHPDADKTNHRVDGHIPKGGKYTYHPKRRSPQPSGLTFVDTSPSGFDVHRNASNDELKSLRSRRAMYWGAPDRVYRLTRTEQENGKAVCPKCREEMGVEPFTKKDKLYTCQSCGFKVPTSKTTTTRITVDVENDGEVDVDVTTAGRGRKSKLAKEMTASGLWETKTFMNQQEMDRWVRQNEHKYQWEQIFINQPTLSSPSHAVQYRKLRQASEACRRGRFVAMDFPDQKALDKYLDDHPDADRSKHHVVKHDTSKSETHPYNLMRQRKNEEKMKEIGKHYKKDPKDLTVDDITKYNQSK